MHLRAHLPQGEMLGVDHQPMAALVAAGAVRIDRPEIKVVVSGPGVEERRHVAC